MIQRTRTSKLADDYVWPVDETCMSCIHLKTFTSAQPSSNGADKRKIVITHYKFKLIVHNSSATLKLVKSIKPARQLMDENPSVKARTWLYNFNSKIFFLYAESHFLSNPWVESTDHCKQVAIGVRFQY